MGREIERWERYDKAGIEKMNGKNVGGGYIVITVTFICNFSVCLKFVIIK